MKQVQHTIRRWIKGVVTTTSMFVFSVSLASGSDITTTPNTSTPYSYSNSNSTAPSYNDVGRPVDEQTQSVMLDNEALGLSSPVAVSTGYSSNYGYELNASFTHNLGFYDAVSLLGAYAPQENRVDITWAHAWTENQRTKLSAERLEEAMDFDYDSGSVTEWVPQYAYGAGYQYLFNKNWLKNVELSGYYAQAQSQNLDTIRFTGTDGNLYDNYRHIAGATSKGSEATLNVSPWKTGLVGLGLNYDSVNYDTKYSDTEAEDSTGFGFTLSLEQLLSKHVKLDLEGSQREIYDDYVAGVSFLTPSNLEVGVNGERTLGENGSASDSRFNLNLAYFFDDKNRYENGYNLEDASQTDLASWASKSAAYMNEVLAAADQQTVQIVAPGSTTPDSQSTDTTPVLNLTVGEINRIDISSYITSANLTEAQKQATPVIKGGPSEVGFTYDNATQTLITKTEVPASVANETFEPLVLVFPTDSTRQRVLTSGNLTDASTDSLAFKVTVGSKGTTPSLNPAFVQQLSAITGHDVNQVFKVYNVEDPTNTTQDSTTMYINPSVTTPVYINSHGGSVKFTNNPNNCYAFVADDTDHILTVTSNGSATCPGTATIEVDASNGLVMVPVQTITYTASSADTPFVYGAPITSPVMLENQVYSPGYAFPTSGDTNVVSPGEGQSFSTNAGDNTLMVCNASTHQEITDSNLELGVASSQITLQSSTAIPSKYVGTTFDIYLSVKNTEGLTGNNGTSCGAGTPFSVTVEGAPHIPDNIPLDVKQPLKVDTSYSYDFMTDGGSAYNVTSGTSAITSISGSTIVVKDSSGNEILNGQDLSGTLGLALAQQGDDVVLSGIINPGYTGDTVYVTLNLANQYGTSNNNTAVATVIANDVYKPSVAGGQTLDAGTLGSTYSYTFPNTGDAAVTAGTGEKFDTATSATYATVTDSVTGVDLSSNFSLTFDTDATQITLISGTYALTTSNPINVVLHVANIDHLTDDNASNPDHFDVTANPANAPQVTGGAITDGTQYSTYTYLFPTSGSGVKVYAGDNGESFDETKTTFTVTDSNGTDQSSLFNLTYGTDSTNNNAAQITLTSGANQLAVQKDWTVQLNVVNIDGQTASGQFTLTVDANASYAPKVNGGALPAVNVGETFPTYTYANNPNDSSAPYAYAGSSTETFSSASKVVSVVGTVSGDLTQYFTLGLTNSDTQVQLIQADPNFKFSNDETLTVTLNLVNNDGVSSGDQTAGTVLVGSTVGYLSCPTTIQEGSSYLETTTSSLMNASTGGSVLKTISFTNTHTALGSNPGAQLYGALLSTSGNQVTLTCNYMNQLDSVMDYVSKTTITTVDENGVQGVEGTGWSSATQCNLGTNTPNDTSCQVKYTYAGQ